MGEAKDELVGEDVRQHRRTVRLARAAITVVVTFALLAAGSTVLTLRQLEQTRRARNEAELRARVATSRLLARVATDNLNDRPALALLEGLKGFQTADTSDSRNALAEALQRVPRLAAVLPAESEATAVAVNPVGSVLALGTSDGSIALWDPIKRQPTGTTCRARWTGAELGVQFRWLDAGGRHCARPSPALGCAQPAAAADDRSGGVGRDSGLQFEGTRIPHRHGQRRSSTTWP